jgi:preprotein translocase subunit SecE
MESQTETPNAQRFDALLLAAAAVLLAGAMVSFYYFSAELNALVRVVILLAAVAAALGLAYKTELGRTIWSYITGARTELRKVVWPSRQEALQATLMIAVVVLITSLILWGLDSALLFGVKALTGQS